MLLSLALVLASAPTTQDEDLVGPDHVNWNQPRGTASGTAQMAFEPVRTQPTEAWRTEFDELLSNVVQWSGSLYVVVMDGRERKLVALDVETGEQVANSRLSRGGGAAYLAAWNGDVVLLDEENIRVYAHRGRSLRGGKRLKGSWRLPPTVHEGTLFLGNGGVLSAIDLDSLELFGTAEAGGGQPSVLGEGADATIATFAVESRSGYRGNWIRLYLTRAHDLGTSDASIIEGRKSWGPSAGNTRIAETGYLAYCGEDPDNERPTWYLRSTHNLSSYGDGPHGGGLVNSKTSYVASIVTDAVVFDEQAFGFDEDGALVRVDLDGDEQVLVERENLPDGARAGAGTAAGGVLYLGNWAVEAGSGRLLWCDPDLDPDGGLLPVADGRLVYVQGGEIVSLVGTRGAAATTLGAGLATATGAPLRPGRGALCITSDGAVLKGEVEFRDDGSVFVETEASGDRLVTPDRLAYAKSSRGSHRLVLQYPVYYAWRRTLHEEFRGVLEELIAEYAKDRHLREVQRLLKEASRYGLSAERRREIQDGLVGKRELDDATARAKLERKHQLESERRAEVWESFHEAASWCIERELMVAASALMADSREVVTARVPTRLATTVAPLIPPAFPWPDDVDRWLDWTRALLPAEAGFVPLDDPSCEGLPPRWRNDVFVLRTPNLLLLSKLHDVDSIGRVLRVGEGVVRALEEVLGAREDAPDARLQLRVFADRESFAAALGDERHGSNGSYRRQEGHTAVHALDESDDRSGDALARAVARDLTRHWIDRRWAPPGERDPATPGYWVAAGFARFVEEQDLALGSERRGFGDTYVEAIEVTARFAELDALLPLSRLMDASRNDYERMSSGRLNDDALVLSTTGRRAYVSERELFVDQSAALVHLLVNRTEGDTRELLLEYMRAFHADESAASGWKALGFRSSHLLERELEGFLEQAFD